MFQDHWGHEEGDQAWPNFARGEEVAGFVVEGRLDSGSFGSVYRARRGGRPFAIKLVPLADRGEREADALRRVRHPNVVGFHGYGFWPHEQPRFLVLALEFVEGWPLEVWARESNPPALELVRQVLLPVARALEEVHAAGVVHRDVKESNILVREADGQPVLVDFGAAAYEGSPRLTRRLPPGTPEYRSPEVLRFAREWEGERYPAGPADDLWALGVTLYSLLTRELPFGDRHGALTRAILEAAPVPPHERNPRVPQPLGELCLRMLEKRPEARFGDAPALVAALEAVCARADERWDVPLFPGARGRPRVAARTRGPGPRPPGARRSWLAAVLLAGVVGLAPWSDAARDDPPEEPGHSPPATLSGETPPREAGLCREVASPEMTGEVGAVQQPLTSKDDPMPKHPKPLSPLSSTVLASVACMGVACAGHSRQAPSPADCPAGADETHARFNVRGSDHGVLFAPYDIKVHPVEEGPITAQAIGAWEKFSGDTYFKGRVYFGKERVFVRFTGAQLPDGEKVPVCFQVIHDQVLGIPMAPGSSRKQVMLYPSVSIETVKHFD